MERVVVADVVSARKLGYLSLHMIRAEMVKRADIAALDHGPERVNALGAHLTPDVFPDAVLDRFVVGEALITAMFVRVDRRVRRGVILDKALQRDFVGAVYRLGNDAVRRAVLGPYHDRLAGGRAGAVLL